MTRPRFSLATIMMMVVAAASASALFARVLPHFSAGTGPGTHRDFVAAFLAGIALTGFVLGGWRQHATALVMLQITLTYLDLLALLALWEWPSERGLIWWFQGSFAFLVFAPLMIRRNLDSSTNPRRDGWMTTCEAVALAFLNMLLVMLGIGCQWAWLSQLSQVLNF